MCIPTSLPVRNHYPFFIRKGLGHGGSKQNVHENAVQLATCTMAFQHGSLQGFRAICPRSRIASGASRDNLQGDHICNISHLPLMGRTTDGIVWQWKLEVLFRTGLAWMTEDIKLSVYLWGEASARSHSSSFHYNPETNSNLYEMISWVSVLLVSQTQENPPILVRLCGIHPASILSRAPIMDTYLTTFSYSSCRDSRANTINIHGSVQDPPSPRPVPPNPPPSPAWFDPVKLECTVDQNEPYGIKGKDHLR